MNEHKTLQAKGRDVWLVKFTPANHALLGLMMLTTKYQTPCLTPEGTGKRWDSYFASTKDGSFEYLWPPLRLINDHWWLGLSPSVRQWDASTMAAIEVSHMNVQKLAEVGTYQLTSLKLWERVRNCSRLHRQNRCGRETVWGWPENTHTAVDSHFRNIDQGWTHEYAWEKRWREEEIERTPGHTQQAHNVPCMLIKHSSMGWLSQVQTTAGQMGVFNLHFATSRR